MGILSSAFHDRESDVRTFNPSSRDSHEPPPPPDGRILKTPPEILLQIFSFLPLGSGYSFQRSCQYIYSTITTALQTSKIAQSYRKSQIEDARRLCGIFEHNENPRDGEGCFASVEIQFFPSVDIIENRYSLEYYELRASSRVEFAGMGWNLENLHFVLRVPILANEADFELDSDGDSAVACEVLSGASLFDSSRSIDPQVTLPSGHFVWLPAPLRIVDDGLRIQLSPFRRPVFEMASFRRCAGQKTEPSVFDGTRIHARMQKLREVPLFGGLNLLKFEPIVMPRKDE